MARAEYGASLISELSKLMTADFGKGFTVSNLKNMRQFYLTFPIDIILCADKSDAVVKYTLPEQNTQIFASKYKLYLLTEEELCHELKRKYKALEYEIYSENKK